MPIITVSMFGGRTQIEKDRLGETITEEVKNTESTEKGGGSSD